MSTVCERLAKYCNETSRQALPQSVIEHTKKLVLDHFALSLAGLRVHTEGGADVTRFARVSDKEGEASLFGSGARASCEHAAFVNAVIAAYAGFDSVHKQTVIHLCPVLVPTVFAVGETVRATGVDLIRAIVIGGEIAARLGLALGSRGTYARGFHPTGVCGCAGSMAGAGILLGLDASQMAEGLCLAAAFGAGSSVWAGSRLPSSFELQIGHAAATGVKAATLAAMGFDGVHQIFEDERGFLKAHSTAPNIDALFSGLGTGFEIMNISLKRFSVSDPNKVAVEALLAVMEKHSLSADEIASIELRVPTTIVPLYGTLEYPANRGGTRVNSRYVIAAGAYVGAKMRFNIDFAGADTRNDARIQDLFRRIDVVGDAELDRQFPKKKACRIRIVSRDGRKFEVHNENPPKGDPECPLEWSDIEEKVRSFAYPAFDEKWVNEAIAQIAALDSVKDAAALCRKLFIPLRVSRG